MRVVVVGAGAVGGVIGGRLAEAGFDVTLVARGAHADAMRRDGLTVESPDGTVVVHPDVHTSPATVGWSTSDIALLAVKSQDTVAALDVLREHAPVGTPIVCAQNGVSNEREALRRFPTVIGMNVMCPTTHLVPGVVQANCAPVSGILDVGRYPGGVDDTCAELAGALSTSRFVSEPRPDVMRWKHAKLLLNLGNAVEALCGAGSGAGPVAARARDEGRAVLAAAGIAVASAEEERARRGDLLRVGSIGDRPRGGGSTWQSVVRGGSVEVDHLNGEIVLLGRLHGVPTPVNELLRERLLALVAAGGRPGDVTPDELLAALEGST